MSTARRALVGVAVVGLFGGALALGARLLRPSPRQATRVLFVDDEFVLQDMRVTLVNVTENDPKSDRDEDVRLILDTPTSSDLRTIEEMRSEILENYRIRIGSASAGAGKFDSGSAEIEVTQIGPRRNGQGLPQPSRSTTLRLRAGEGITFGALQLRVINVFERESSNDRYEDVGLTIDTPTLSEQRWIRELRSEFTDHFRIRIVDARAASDASGAGAAEIEITDFGMEQQTLATGMRGAADPLLPLP